MPRFRGAGAAAASSAFTYQARLIVDQTIDAALTAFACWYGYAERCLFAATARGNDPDKIKPAFSRQPCLTARQFNAVSARLKAKVASIRKHRISLIGEGAARIEKALEVIKKLSRKTKQSKAINEAQANVLALGAYRPAETQRLFAPLHKKSRLATLDARYAALVTDNAAGVVRIAFGSRELFDARFDLAANGYASRADWLRDWQAAPKRAVHGFGQQGWRLPAARTAWPPSRRTARWR